MRLVAAGISFQSAPLSLRERVVVGSDEARSLLRYLVGRAGLTAAAVLSTCNRTEFYVICPDDVSAAAVTPQLSRYLDPGNAGLGDHMVEWRDAAAVEHILRVGAGLESMVLGEAQVLGQVKAAHRLAQAAQTLDPALDLILRRAIEVGKRVRTETPLGRGAGSLSEVATRCLRSAVGDLDGRGVLVVGAGTMGRLVARRLREEGANLRLSSRTAAAVEVLADEVGGEAVAAGDLDRVIRDVDAVVSSTSSPTAVISARDVARWQAVRHGAPLLLVDLAVPRDIDPAAGEIANVTIVDVDELGRHVDQGLALRRDAVPMANRLTTAAAGEVWRELGARHAAAPAIAEIVRHAEAIRVSEVARALAPDTDPAIREMAERLSQALVRKLLHLPITALREHADDRARCQVIHDALVPVLVEALDEQLIAADLDITGRIAAGVRP